MRVTLVSPFDPHPPDPDTDKGQVGGVERVFSNLSNRLAARGHEVTLVCSSGQTTGNTVERGVRVVRQERFGTFMRAPIASLARCIPPDSDVVHVAATYPFITPAVLARAKKMAVPSVLDFHFEPVPPGLLGGVAASAYRQVGSRLYSDADAVLVRSMDYGRSAPSLQRVPEDRWHVVPNGIDPAEFHPMDGPTDLDVPETFLLFVGRLVPYKGLSVLLRAMAEARIQVPLVIVGDGPLRPALERSARSLGLDVRFLGRVADGVLPRLYSQATLTLLPSVNRQEAFGISLLESMACGTPVVASSLPGVAALAAEGGLVAPPGDTDRLAEAIRTALDSDELPRGQALADRIHARYSWDAVTDRLIDVYAGLAQRRGETAPCASSR